MFLWFFFSVFHWKEGRRIAKAVKEVFLVLGAGNESQLSIVKNNFISTLASLFMEIIYLENESRKVATRIDNKQFN